jgi:hypothetical protein
MIRAATQRNQAIARARAQFLAAKTPFAREAALRKLEDLGAALRPHTRR